MGCGVWGVGPSLSTQSWSTVAFVSYLMHALGFRVGGVRFQSWGSGFGIRDPGLGFRVTGSECGSGLLGSWFGDKNQVSGLRAPGSGFPGTRSETRFRIQSARVQGSGFRVWGSESGFRVPGSGYLVSGSGFRVWTVGFRRWGFRVPGFGFRVSGSGSRVAGFAFWVPVWRFRCFTFADWGAGLRVLRFYEILQGFVFSGFRVSAFGDDFALEVGTEGSQQGSVIHFSGFDCQIQCCSFRVQGLGGMFRMESFALPGCSFSGYGFLEGFVFWGGVGFALAVGVEGRKEVRGVHAEEGREVRQPCRHERHYRNLACV